MNYQQWKSVADNPPPLQRWVTITPGGYVMRGLFKMVNGMLCCADWRGREHFDCLHWSWSDTEPDAEQLMVKPHGIFMAHWWNEVGHLLNIIRDFDVKFFVEIGLLDGGLTSMLLSECEYGQMRYFGINLGLSYLDSRVVKIAQRMEMPIFDIDAWSPESVKLVGDCVNHRHWPRECRTMIYCDGGDKAKEAHLYWPILRPGDLLGLHDYSDDPDAKGPEVYPKDVADFLQEGKRIGREELAETRILLLEKV